MRDDGRVAGPGGCPIRKFGGNLLCAYLNCGQFQEQTRRLCCRSFTIFFLAELFGLRCSCSPFLADTALFRPLTFTVSRADRQLNTPNSRAGWSRLRASLSPPWAPFISRRRFFCR